MLFRSSGSIPEYTQGNLESGSERWRRCAGCMRADAAYPDKNMSTNFNKPFQTFFSFHPARSSYRKVGSSSATNCQSAPPFLKFAMILELVSCCWNEAEDTRGIRKCAVRMFSRPRFSFGREQGIVYPRLDIVRNMGNFNFSQTHVLTFFHHDEQCCYPFIPYFPISQP